MNLLWSAYYRPVKTTAVGEGCVKHRRVYWTASGATLALCSLIMTRFGNIADRLIRDIIQIERDKYTDR